MQIDRQLIINTYEAAEEMAGGIAKADPAEIITQVCLRLQMHREIVEEVLVNHWTQNGAG